MQALGKGEYSGKVVDFFSQEGITASVTTYHKRSFNNQLHFHDNTHVSFVLHGGCAEKKKDRYERLPGKLTCYYSGEPHQVIHVAEHSRHINLEIEPFFFQNNQLLESDLFAAMTANPDGRLLMLRIFRELLFTDEHSSASINLLLLNLAHKGGAIRYSRPMPAWINLTKAYLHDNWSSVVSLQELAHITNVHPVTISKYFSKYFSCTLGEYMRKLKIEKALSLLKSENIPLTSIAYECGFADQSHFIRTFKSLTGFLPTQYQQL